MPNTADWQSMMREAQRLFGGAKFRSALTLSEQMYLDNPYDSAALALAVASKRALGQVKDLERILNYQENVLRFSLETEPRKLAEIVSCIENLDFVAPSEKMPIVLGFMTKDLVQSGDPAIDYLADEIRKYFISYIAQTRRHHTLASCPAKLAIRLWVNKLLPGGAIGAHYHPSSWLSAVYYPKSFS